MSYRIIIRGARARYRAQEFACNDCEILWSETVAKGDSVNCECGQEAEPVISASMLGGSWRASAVSRGENEKPPPGSYSTEAIADGMPVSEWRAQRAKIHRARRSAEARQETGSTGTLYSHS